MSFLFDVELLAGLVFIGFILLIVVGGVVAVSSNDLVRATSGLILSMSGVAWLYYFLGSPFLTMMQILIYAGAICVAIVFAVMLSEPKDVVQNKPRKNPAIETGAAIAGAFIAWSLAAIAIGMDWGEGAEKVNEGGIEDIGREMMTDFVVSFELISLILLIAIIGALVLARSGRTRKE